MLVSCEDLCDTRMEMGSGKVLFAELFTAQPGYYLLCVSETGTDTLFTCREICYQPGKRVFVFLPLTKLFERGFLKTKTPNVTTKQCNHSFILNVSLWQYFSLCRRIPSLIWPELFQECLQRGTWRKHTPWKQAHVGSNPGTCSYWLYFLGSKMKAQHLSPWVTVRTARDKDYYKVLGLRGLVSVHTGRCHFPPLLLGSLRVWWSLQPGLAGRVGPEMVPYDMDPEIHKEEKTASFSRGLWF